MVEDIPPLLGRGRPVLDRGRDPLRVGRLAPPAERPRDHRPAARWGSARRAPPDVRRQRPRDRGRAGGAVRAGRAPDRVRAAVGDRAPRELSAASACPATTLMSVAVGFVGVALLVLPGRPPRGRAARVVAPRRGGGGPLGQRLVRGEPGRAAERRAHGDRRGRCSSAARRWWSWAWPLGEAGELHLGEISLDSWAAFVFLVFIGSIAAFTAYNWLLQHVAHLDRRHLRVREPGDRGLPRVGDPVARRSRRSSWPARP